MIDAAVAENRYWEKVCLILTIAFPTVGILVLLFGTYRGEGLVALSGAISSGLFWPALQYAIAIRQTNIAIRLLEVPLTNAKSSEQAASAIQEAFVSHFVKGTRDVDKS